MIALEPWLRALQILVQEQRETAGDAGAAAQDPGFRLRMEAVGAPEMRRAAPADLMRYSEARGDEQQMKPATALRFICRAAMALPPQHPLCQALTRWVLRLTGAELSERSMRIEDLIDGVLMALPLIAAALQG